MDTDTQYGYDTIWIRRYTLFFSHLPFFPLLIYYRQLYTHIPFIFFPIYSFFFPPHLLLLPLPLYFFSAKHSSTKLSASSSSLHISEQTPKKAKRKSGSVPFLTRVEVCPVCIWLCRRCVRVGHQYDTGTRGFFPCRCFIDPVGCSNGVDAGRLGFRADTCRREGQEVLKEKMKRRKMRKIRKKMIKKSKCSVFLRNRRKVDAKMSQTLDEQYAM